jgi:KaiC/GvpD/RAD55 family RecA-like ATPase
MSIQRISTGIPGIDELIEGGFPSDGMILLVGHAGAGKSIFTSQFIYNCAVRYGIRGVYACLAETKETFLRNMREFGWDFERLEREGRVGVLCLPVSKEAGVQTNLNKIMDAIESLKAKVLVIDSFSTIATALKEKIDIRVMLHLLYQFIKKSNSLCILIVDELRHPHFFSSGEGIAEFMADGIVTLELYIDDNGVLRRRMRILKMRGTDHSKVAHPYRIMKGGFTLSLEGEESKATQEELLHLTELEGVGISKAHVLYDAGIKTKEDIRRVPLERLASLPQIGSDLARRMKEQASE